jgi:hypothetical protein
MKIRLERKHTGPGTKECVADRLRFLPLCTDADVKKRRVKDTVAVHREGREPRSVLTHNAHRRARDEVAAPDRVGLGPTFLGNDVDRGRVENAVAIDHKRAECRCTLLKHGDGGPRDQRRVAHGLGTLPTLPTAPVQPDGVQDAGPPSGLRTAKGWT